MIAIFEEQIMKISNEKKTKKPQQIIWKETYETKMYKKWIESKKFVFRANSRLFSALLIRITPGIRTCAYITVYSGCSHMFFEINEKFIFRS